LHLITCACNCMQERYDADKEQDLHAATHQLDSSTQTVKSGLNSNTRGKVTSIISRHTNKQLDGSREVHLPHDSGSGDARLHKGNMIQVHKGNNIKLHNSKSVHLHNESQSSNAFHHAERETMGVSQGNVWGTRNVLWMVFALVTTALLSFW
jgi:hypothetical protein